MPSQEVSDPIRDRVIAARRAQILDAAAKVFAEHGFHQTTIHQVAEMAGVADGTIYNYFENKDDLLVSLITRLHKLDVSEEHLSELSQEDFKSAFLELLSGRIALYRANLAVFKAFIPEALVNPELRQLYYCQHIAPMVASLEKHLETRARDGHIRRLNFRLAARAMVAMLVGFLVLFILGDQTLQEEDPGLPETLATLLYVGLQPQGRD
jgi:AcrR family transcriptional regulator